MRQPVQPVRKRTCIHGLETYSTRGGDKKIKSLFGLLLVRPRQASGQAGCTTLIRLPCVAAPRRPLLTFPAKPLAVGLLVWIRHDRHQWGRGGKHETAPRTLVTPFFLGPFDAQPPSSSLLCSTTRKSATEKRAHKHSPRVHATMPPRYWRWQDGGTLFPFSHKVVNSSRASTPSPRPEGLRVDGGTSMRSPVKPRERFPRPPADGPRWLILAELCTTRHRNVLRLS